MNKITQLQLFIYLKKTKDYSWTTTKNKNEIKNYK